MIVYGKNYTIKPVEKKHADSLVEDLHYSGKAVPNTQINLGVFDKDDIMVGCLQFGPPINGDKSASKISNETRMYELNRMVMNEDQPRNSESQAISLCMTWMRRNTDARYILSFSDGKQGNCGYIYQASNWKYLGYLLSNSFYDLDGDIVHNITLWHRYKEKHPLKDQHTTLEIACMHHKSVSRLLCKQHVFVFPLYKNVKFLHTTKPYPKKDKEVAVLSRTYYKKEGVLVDPYTTETYTDEVLQSIW